MFKINKMDLIRILSDQKEELSALNLQSLISRPEEKEIDINSKFAQVVIGVRRCGKSTLCQKVLLESKVNFGYVNFDDERLIGLRSDQLDELLSTLYRLNGKFNHIFLDEVQNIKNWQLFINRLLRSGMHVMLTGSNANLLSSDLITHLAGRYNEIELFPFSFSEFCEARKEPVEGLSTKSIGLLKKALDDYLRIGGFPEIVEGLAPRHYASNLISTIVRKDIVRRYRLRYNDVIWKLCNRLLDNIGQTISYTDLADKLGVKSFHTIEKYVEYLVNAYLLLSVKKFSFKAIDRKLSSKGYAIDMAFVTDHEDKNQTEGLGWRLENVVAIELIRRLRKTNLGLYYGEKSRQYNVDFLIATTNRIEQLIQVTYDFRNPSTKLYNREIGNLIKGAEITKCQDLMLIIMEGESQVLHVKEHTIKIVSAIDWLLSRNDNTGVYGG